MNVWVWFLTKRAKICLKRAKYLKKLDKNYRRETKFGSAFEKGRKSIYRTMGPEQISINYKNIDENKKWFLPLDELAAPFFGENESIISVKNKIQFVFNLFVDTIEKQKKKKNVFQFVCVLELKLVFFNKLITIQF